MPFRLRKVVLVAHIATSVGWMGAVMGYVALDVVVATSHDESLVRAAYVAMGVILMRVIVPLALATVLIGAVCALGSPWGLLRHYWVVVKLLLTAFATVVLLVESRVVAGLAANAAAGADPRGLPDTLPHSVGGLVVLVTGVVLSVFKPRGMTRYGWRLGRSERNRGGVRREPF